MFILRLLSEQGESDIFLGKSYTFTHEVHHPEEFNRLLKLSEEEKGNLCAYIHSENGERFRVFNSNSAFIMTESGKTFARLS